MSNDNGEILIRDASHKFVPATLPLLQELGRRLTRRHINIKPGAGDHPLVQMQTVAVTYTAGLMQGDEESNFGDLDRVSAEDVQRTMARLIGASKRGQPFLIEMTTHEIKIAGACVAANASGVLSVKWDLAEANFDTDNVRIVKASLRNHKILALIPANIPQVTMPETLWAVSSQGEGLQTTPITLQDDFIDTSLISVRTSGYHLLTAKREMTSREQALHAMGMERERFSGERPSGIDLSPPLAQSALEFL